MDHLVPAFLRNSRRLRSSGVPFVLDVDIRCGKEQVSISRNFLKWYAHRNSVFYYDQDVITVPEKFQSILHRFADIFYEDILVDRLSEAPLLEELLEHFQLNWFIGDNRFPSKLCRAGGA